MDTTGKQTREEMDCNGQCAEGLPAEGGLQPFRAVCFSWWGPVSEYRHPGSRISADV